MDRMDIYVGDDMDSLDVYDVAALYNCSVISIDGYYATVEGKPRDLDNLAKFLARENMYR